jgi:putative transposase
MSACTSSHSERWRRDQVESLNAPVRGCLNINAFWSPTQARRIISDGKHDDHHHQRHSSLTDPSADDHS